MTAAVLRAQVVPQPACKGRDVRLFDSTNPELHLVARRYCGQCPMVRECLARALDIAARHQPGSVNCAVFGTWGGLLWKYGEIVPVKVPGASEMVESIRRERGIA